MGLDDIVAQARQIEIAMNVATPTWGPFLPSLNFLKSFPDPDGAGPEPAGLKVQTGGEPVVLDFDRKLLRASVRQATLQLSDFLYLGGSFALEAGPTYSVTVNSGIPTDILAEIAASSDLQSILAPLGFDLATGTLTHSVDSLTIGGSNVTLFAGVNGPYWTDLDLDGQVSWAYRENDGTYTTLAADDALVTIGGKQYGDVNANGIVDAQETAELDANAVGLVATDLDFGLAVLQSNSPVFSLLAPVPGLGLLAELVRPRYFAVRGTAYNVGFVGLQEIQAQIVNLAVELNVATPWGPLLPALDFAESFPGEDTNANGALDTEDANGNGVLDAGEDANGNGVLDAEDRDGDAQLDPAGLEVFTGSDSYYLDFDTGLIRASVGQATLRVRDLVAFSGRFAFSAESRRTVPLTDGRNQDVAILMIAAQNVYGFVGANGPYRWDTNHDGVIDAADPVNTNAVGFAVDNFHLAMAIAVGTELLNPSLYLALKASADTIGLVGIPGASTDSDGLDLSVNIGLSLSSSAAIDFSQLPGGGLAVGFGETGSGATAGGEARFLNFSQAKLKGHLKARISLLGVEFDGTFGFDEGTNNSTVLVVLANFKVAVGDLVLYESLASGVLQIGDGGLAGKILLESQSADPLAGLGLSGVEFSESTRFELLLNTTEKEVDILLPDYFDVFTAFELSEAVDYSAGVVLSDQLTTLKSTGAPADLEYHLFLPKTQNVPPAPVPDAHPEVPGESYILIHADGSLALPGMRLEGTFDFKASGSEALLILNADFAIGAAGFTLLELKAAGILRINDAGIAGKISLRQVSDLPEDLNIAGWTFDADTTFDLLVNTTLAEADILLPETFDVFDAFGLSEAVDYSGGVLLPDKLTRLWSSPRGPPEDGEFDYHLLVPKEAVLPDEPQPGPEAQGEFYILVRAQGRLELPGALLEGSFNLFADEANVLMVVGGHLLITYGSLELLDLVAGGAFQLDHTGFAGKLQLSLDTQSTSAPLAELFEGVAQDAGFAADVQFDLVVNTTALDKDILLPETFDPFPAFAVSAADRAILEDVGPGDEPQWVWLSDDLTRLQAQYDPVAGRVEYHLLVPQSPQRPPAAGPSGEFYLLVHAVGELAFPGFILDGGFDLFVYRQNAVMDIHAVMAMKNYFELNAVGIVQIDEAGIAGRISLEVVDDNPPLSALPGLSFQAEFYLIVNTTKQVQEIVFPERFNNPASFGLSDEEEAALATTGSVVLQDGLTRLKAVALPAGTTAYHLIVKNTPARDTPPPEAVPAAGAAGAFFLLLYAHGDLCLPGATLTGSFYLRAEETQTVMTVSGHLVVGFGTLELLDLKAGGAFYLAEAGLAGKLQLELDQSVPLADLFGPGCGFDQEAFFDLTINLTREVQDFALPESFDAPAVFGVDPDEIRDVGDEVLLSDQRTRLRRVRHPTTGREELHLIVPATPTPGQEAESYLLVHAVGALTVPGFTLRGGFDLFVDAQRATLDIHALLTVGFGDWRVLQLEALGVAQLDGTGIAGKIHLRLIDDENPPTIPGVDPLSAVPPPLSELPGLGTGAGFDADARFDLILNTTRRCQDILLPDRFDDLASFGITNQQEADLRGVAAGAPVASVLLPDRLTRLKAVYIDATRTEFHLIVNPTPDTAVGPPVEIPASNSGTGARYLVVHAEGRLTLPGAVLAGTFDLEANEEFAVMAVNATLSVRMGAATLLELAANGFFRLDASGLAGRIRLQLLSAIPPDDPRHDSQAADPGADLGFTMTGQFDLIVNTTGNHVHVPLPAHVSLETLRTIFDLPEGPYDGAGVPLRDGLTRFRSEPNPVNPQKTDYYLVIANTPQIPQPVIPVPDGAGRPYLLVHAEGGLAFPGLEMAGTFDLEITEQSALMAVNATLLLRAGEATLLELAANGFLKVDAYGTAGKVQLELLSAIPAEDPRYDPQAAPPGTALGFTMTGRFDLILNTTKNRVEILLPAHLSLATLCTIFDLPDAADYGQPVLLRDGLTRFRSEPNPVNPEKTDYYLVIANTPQIPPPVTPVPDGAGRSYFLVHAEGGMAFPGLEMAGTFDLEITEQSTMVAVAAEVFLGFDQVTLLKLVAGGVLQMRAGGVAGKLKLRLASELDPADRFYDLNAPAPFSGLGLALTGQFDLVLNTMGHGVALALPDHFDAFTVFAVAPADQAALQGVLPGQVVSVLLADGLTRLESRGAPAGGIALTLVVPNTPQGEVPGAGTQYLLFHAEGTFRLQTSAETGFYLCGVFDMELDSAGWVVTADARLEARVAGQPILSLGATGALLVNGRGVAARMELTLGGGADLGGSGFALGGNFLFELNTSNTRVVRIGNHAADLEPGPYGRLIVDNGHLQLTVGSTKSFRLDGRFALRAGSGGFELAAEATLKAVVANLTLLSLEARGALLINAQGVAAQISLNAGGGYSGSGFSFCGQFTLEVNTTTQAVGTIAGQSVNLPAGPYARVTIVGYLRVLNLVNLDGAFVLTVGSSGVSASASAKVRIFGVSFNVVAGTTINSSGLVLHAGLSFSSGSSFVPFPGIQIFGSFTLQINTTASNDPTYGIPHNTIRVLVANGSLNVLGFRTGVGSVNIVVDSSGFKLSVRDLALDVGPLHARLSGDLYSSGYFRFTAQADLYAEVYIWPFTYFFSAKTYITLGSSEFRFYASGSVGIVGWVSIGASANLVITGTGLSFSLAINLWPYPPPLTINLGNISPVPPAAPTSPPPLARWDVGGTLTLHMGPYASARGGLYSGYKDEAFTITHVSGDGSYETVQVSAFGYTQTYSRVNRIVAYAGDGNDSVDFDGNVRCNVVIDGGDGDDSLSYRGYGSATIGGGNGNDTLIVTQGTNHVLEGGAGDDMLLGGSGNDTLRGGLGRDTLDSGGGQDGLDGGDGTDMVQGGDGNDTLDGGAGNDVLEGGAGNDTLQGGADNDTYVFRNGFGADTFLDSTSQESMDFGTVTAPVSVVLNGSEVRFSINGGTVAVQTGAKVTSIILGPGNDTLKVEAFPAYRVYVQDKGGDDSYEFRLAEARATITAADLCAVTSGVDILDEQGAQDRVFVEQVSSVYPLHLNPGQVTNGSVSIDFRGMEGVTIFGNGAALDLPTGLFSSYGGGISLATTARTGAVNLGAGTLRLRGQTVALLADMAAGSMVLEFVETLTLTRRLMATDEVRLTSSAGLAGGGLVKAARLWAQAQTGIVLNTEVQKVCLSALGPGDIRLTEADDILLRELIAADGTVAVTAGGTITALSVISQTDRSGCDVHLVSRSGHALIGLIQAGRWHGAVTVEAAGDIREIDAFDLHADIVGNRADLTAGGEIGSASAADLNLEMDLTESAHPNDLVEYVVGDLVLNLAADVVGSVFITATGGITVTHLKAHGGQIRLSALGGDIRVDYVDAGAGQITLTAAQGSIYEADEDEEADVIAAGLLLLADTDIAGDSDLNPCLEVETETLHAQAVHGSICLQEADDFQLGSVAAGEEVRLNATGAVWTGGDSLITTGRLHVAAQRGITLNTRVEELTARNGSTGDIRVTEADHIVLREVVAAEGTIEVRAGGTITAGEVRVATDEAGRDIRLTATAGDVLVGLVAVGRTHGRVWLEAQNGLILEATPVDEDADVVGYFGRLHALPTAGVPPDPARNPELDLAVVRHSSTDLVLTVVGDLELNFELTGFAEVTATGTITVTYLTTTGGAVNLTAGGDILLDYLAAGAQGQVHLIAGGSILEVAGWDAQADLIATTAVLSAGASIGNRLSTGHILETSLQVLAAESRSGSIFIHEADSIELAGLVAATGEIGVTAGGAIVVTGDVEAAGGIDLSTPGAVRGATGATVIALGLEAVAGEGIDLNTRIVEAFLHVTGSGALRIAEMDDILIHHAGTADGPIEITAGGAITAEQIESATDSDSNDIILSTVAGAIVADGIAAGALGDVSIDSGGALTATIAGDELTVQARGPMILRTAVTVLNAVTVAAGDVTITETDDLIVPGVVVADGSLAVTAGGDITARHLELRTDADGNDISLVTTGSDITAEEIYAGTWGAVRLIALGALVATVQADELLARAEGPMTLTTTVTRLDVETCAAGDLAITETDDVTLFNVRSFDGSISIAAGTIHAVWVQSLTDSDDHDINLTTTSGSIAVGSISAGVQGDVMLLSAGEITDSAGKIVADVLVVEASGPIAVNTTVNILTATHGGALAVIETDGITLSTTVVSLTLTTEASGEVVISESDGIILTRVVSRDGSISITAGGDITAVLIESRTDADENDIALTTTAGGIVATEIVAGVLGDVYLESAGDLTAGVFADEVFACAAGTMVLNLLDRTPPAAPVIAGIADDTGTAGDGITRDNTLVISGTAEADSTVELFLGGSSLGTAVADSSGVWTFDYRAVSLGDGNCLFTATATDTAGNVSAISTALVVIIDTFAPVIGVDALTTDDATPALTGTVNDDTAGVQLRVNGTIYTAVNRGDGTWALADNQIAPPLVDGIYEVSAWAFDSA
ncbi:MAG: Ig-like domain-containing protein, partial [Planctomycetes bacterium]|nr:Ig-like domain-containing protein [Planctomycetota bacterium]